MADFDRFFGYPLVAEVCSSGHADVGCLSAGVTLAKPLLCSVLEEAF